MISRDIEIKNKLGLHARAAAKLVHSHYTWDRNASRAVELVRSLIAAGGKRTRETDAG